MSQTTLEPIEPGTPAQAAQETRMERARRHAQRVRLYSYATLLVVLLVIVVGLIAANTRHVKVSWVFGSTRISLVWLVLATAIFSLLLRLVTAAVLPRRRPPAPR